MSFQEEADLMTLKNQNKPLSKLVNFDKVKLREFQYQKEHEANEMRFENINKFPKNLSKNKYVQSPDFKKYIDRKPFVQVKYISKL